LADLTSTEDELTFYQNNFFRTINVETITSTKLFLPNLVIRLENPMKIGCYCGATISDSTDYLSHKAHLTPDQDVYGVWDGVDDEVIDPVATGKLLPKDAYMVSRRIIQSPTRLMWQCYQCGRLYIDGPDGSLHCFVPENEETEKRILRSAKSK